MSLQSIVTQGWRRIVQAAMGLGMAAALVACGGGGGGSAGTPVVGPGSGASSPSSAASAVAADVVVVLNKTTMTNSGSDSITATVTTIDANRAVVGSVPVSFAVNGNALVTPGGTSTNATTGTQTAVITQGADSSVRAVTLTVTSGTISRAISFNIVQNSTSTNPQANDLTLTLSSSNIDNSGSRTVTATATAVDNNRNALAGIPVQLSVSDSSAFIVSSSNQTNSSGQVSGTVSIGQDRSNRTVTVVATSGTLTRTAAFQITGARFSQASPVPAVASAGAAGTVQYLLSDVNSNPMPGVTITVSGNGITSATGKTDLNGAYTFNYVAPNAPGTTLVIKAAAGGADSTVNVTIPGGGSTTVPVATTPVSKTLNLSADVVTVNTGSTSNQVTLSAFFRDGANAPVSNVRVLFGVTGDNGTGSVASRNNTVLSDLSGTASTTYSPGAVSSPTNGVTVLACWKVSDFLATDTVSNCAAAGGQLLTTTLTIVSNPVSISIGTDNSIANGASTLTYVKKFVVLVVDSAGNPKSDVQITPSVDLGGFGKGFWVYDAGLKLWLRDDKSEYTITATGARVTSDTLRATCPNEDLNRNGVIDSGEDVNGNLQLDPRKSDVSITLSGSTKTDSNGVAVLQLEYPKNLGSWVKYKITVTAAGVLSPPAYYPLGIPVRLPSDSIDTVQARAAGKGVTTASEIEDYLYAYEWLPVAADALALQSPAPAFANSPYGLNSNCKDVR
ncbi:beta strand repeat-containing protein [Roseateles puraquae]|uniref:beta strand repeat-containing protein n=1 Tax=Roseateles puraquae TaxID=431059 RepID=UPI000B4E6EB8|nr:hypothetical protein [Roseateles puraquae]MDG0854640.1 hypothetical protein [Roseateles puraquae]